MAKKKSLRPQPRKVVRARKNLRKKFRKYPWIKVQFDHGVCCLLYHRPGFEAWPTVLSSPQVLLPVLRRPDATECALRVQEKQPGTRLDRRKKANKGSYRASPSGYRSLGLKVVPVRKWW